MEQSERERRNQLARGIATKILDVIHSERQRDGSVPEYISIPETYLEMIQEELSDFFDGWVYGERSIVTLYGTRIKEASDLFPIRVQYSGGKSVVIAVLSENPIEIPTFRFQDPAYPPTEPSWQLGGSPLFEAIQRDESRDRAASLPVFDREALERDRIRLEGEQNERTRTQVPAPSKIPTY